MIVICSKCGSEIELKGSEKKYLHRNEPFLCSSECLFQEILSHKVKKNSKAKYTKYVNKNEPVNGSVWDGSFRLFFRSDYERMVARQLRTWGFSALYEAFYLDVGSTIYVPDFFIPSRDVFIEVKGLWRGSSKSKMTHVRKEHPKLNLIVVPYTMRSDFY